MVELSEVLRTLLKQLYATNPNWKEDYGVKEVLIVDEKTLRLHCVLSEVDVFVNIDIHYNEGLDLYEIIAHRGLTSDEFDNALMSIGEIIFEDWQNNPKYEKIRSLLRKIHNLMFGMDKIAEYKGFNGITWDQIDEVIRSILRKAERWRDDLMELKIGCFT